MNLSNLKLVETLDLNVDVEGALQINNAINEARGKFPYANFFPYKGKYNIGYEQGLTLLKVMLDNKIVKKEQIALVLEKVVVERSGHENTAWKLTQEFEDSLKEILGAEANDVPTSDNGLSALEREIFG